MNGVYKIDFVLSGTIAYQFRFRKFLPDHNSLHT